MEKKKVCFSAHLVLENCDIKVADFFFVRQVYFVEDLCWGYPVFYINGKVVGIDVLVIDRETDCH